MWKKTTTTTITTIKERRDRNGDIKIYQDPYAAAYYKSHFTESVIIGHLSTSVKYLFSTGLLTVHKTTLIPLSRHSFTYSLKVKNKETMSKAGNLNILTFQRVQYKKFIRRSNSFNK